MIDGDTILVRNPNSNIDSAYQIYWKINDARYSRKDTSFRNYQIQKSKVQSYLIVSWVICHCYAPGKWFQQQESEIKE